MMKKIFMSVAAVSVFAFTFCSAHDNPSGDGGGNGDDNLDEAVQTVIHTEKVLKHNVVGASGVNTCFLTDSDEHYKRQTSTIDALRRIGAGSLRFPYGHLADNYLWTVPPYEDAVDGLRPKVASMDVPPAQWQWAIDKDGFFKKDLGFDDYVAMCKELGAEPLVVVNVLSFQYKGGPSQEELVRSAAEWVRYANVTRKYGIRYWQLGNEVEKQDGKSSLTKDKYLEIFGQMSSAMKTVDPTICICAGVQDNAEWNQAVLGRYKAAGLVDCIACHQYTWKIPLRTFDYNGWKEYEDVYVPHVRKTEKYLNENPAWDDVELLITETNSKGAGVEWAEGQVCDLYKALCFYEMNMEELSSRHVKYTYFWTTHSPWLGENPSGRPLDCCLDKENEPTASGMVLELINRYLLPDILDLNVSYGYIRIRASVSEDGNAVNVFVLNKGDRKTPVNLCIKDNEDLKAVERIVFSGKSPRDQYPEITVSAIEGLGNDFYNTVEPCSLTIFRFEK